MKPQIIVFDGVCNFCNAWAIFVLKRDKRARYKFAAAQTPAGALILQGSSLSNDLLTTIVLVDGDKRYEKSDAILRILSGLGGIWAGARLLQVIPQSLRDYVYTGFASRRYRWFGKSDNCSVPSPEWRERFLE